MRIAVLLAALGLLQAQGEFDAASIKPSKSMGEGASFSRTPGMLVVHNASLLDCIREAYGVGDAQVLGQKLPPDRYDITARAPSGASPDQRPAMLQALLAERFRLAVRREKRELPVYALVLAKGGPKLQEVEPANGGISSGAGKLVATAVPVSRLASFLAGPRLQLGHPVVDRTGLSGVYTFTFEWKPEELFADLEEQLGLKLTAAKGEVDVVIVDHAERPTEN